MKRYCMRLRTEVIIEIHRKLERNQIETKSKFHIFHHFSSMENEGFNPKFDGSLRKKVAKILLCNGADISSINGYSVRDKALSNGSFEIFVWI